MQGMKDQVDEAQRQVLKLREALTAVEANAHLAPELDIVEVLSKLNMLVIRASLRYQELLDQYASSVGINGEQLGIPGTVAPDETTPVEIVVSDTGTGICSKHHWVRDVQDRGEVWFCQRCGVRA